MDILRISATSHAVNYLPEYHAAASGMFARRGLEVRSWARDPWDGVLADLASGEADLALGGVWGPAMYAGAGRDLVAVGQLNARFPKVVVTREPVAGFTFAWLEGRTVLAPGQGGTAGYEFTAGVMREHGADPEASRWVRDLSGDMLRELFEHGLGDAILADTLTAVALVRGGHGHAALSISDLAGPMPNSVYYARRDRLDELHERCVALMGGVAEAMRELCAGADPTELVAAQWPDAPQADLVEAARILAADGTWSGVRIDEAALDRWARILHDRGLTVARHAYSDLVDVRVADAVAAGDPAGSAA